MTAEYEANPKSDQPQRDWVFRMAWRDTRASRGRLLLFISAIVLGVAALVAIGSLGESLQSAVDSQAKTLLGADLSISSRQAFDAASEELLASVPGEQARQLSTSTMAFFPKNSGTRLVELRAIRGDYPFYGELETDPPGAARSFQKGDFALVDDGLLVQYDIHVGDRIRIGTEFFEILGSLKSIPGEAATMAMIGPRVYIPYEGVERAGLIQVGSRVSYRAYFKLPAGVDADKLEDELEPELREHDLRSDTVQDRRRRLGNTLDNLYRFLNLVGFIALLLGGVGVASSIHLYLKQKIATVAILRCLGATARQTFSVYLTQALVLGAVGAAAGALLGVAVQLYLPVLLSDFIPIEVDFQVSIPSILRGVLMGLAMTTLFALFPLLPIRKVSPLLTLRSGFEGSEKVPADPWRRFLVLTLLAAIYLFAWAQTDSFLSALAFCLGLLIVFALLAGTAKLIMWSARRWFPRSWAYVFRQGLANLFRPQNQTVVMMLALGFGTFLIVTLFAVQGSLLEQVRLTAAENRPNLVFFDIQTDQVEGVRNAVLSEGIEVLDEVPMVTMRLESVKGKPVREFVEERGRRGRWAYLREYRSTFRDHLNEAEELVSGEFLASARPGEPAPVSLEEGIAESLHVTLGDSLVFNVQGVPVETVVGSIRRLDWQRMQPGFFVVFPTGVLEKAPQFHVLVARAEDVTASARAQRTVIGAFPNVSAIDLALILSTVDEILSKVAFVIRFMALFSVLTGLIVLTSAVSTSRYQRIRESVLLRTLGASRRQVRLILLIENLLLGFFAALTGLSLAIAAAWALSEWTFETPFVTQWWPVAATAATVAMVTVLVGMLASRGICDRPPLEVLRAEV